MNVYPHAALHHLIRTRIVRVLFLILPLGISAQNDMPHSPASGAEIQFIMTATGQSSGHVADLTMTNPTGVRFESTLPPGIIRSDGTTQGFVIPQPVICNVPAGGKTTIRIQGYCIDRALPVPRMGKSLPPPNDWRKLPHMDKNPFDKNPLDSIGPHTKTDSGIGDPIGAKAHAEGDRVSHAPGSLSKDAIGSETAHTAHSKGNYVSRTPEEDARLRDEVGKIIRALDSIEQKRSLKTPPSGNPVVEKTIITQHTIWVASSPPDQPYTMADICEDLETTWQSIPGQDGTPMPPDEKSAILDAIFATGAGAGIPSFLPTPLPTHPHPFPSLPPSGHPVEQTVKVTGTGRTTGHIADITFHNPTNAPVMARIGTGQLYIPSSGQYQPYIVPDMPPIVIGPKETKTEPIYGYCADIHVPPVPAGSGMPDIKDWTSVPGPGPNDMPENVVTISTRISPPVDDALRTISDHIPDVLSGTNPDCIPSGAGSPNVPVIPGTHLPLPDPGGFGVSDDASILAPVLITTLQRITDAYDRLRRQGDIKTPFSGNDVREKEAVVQQTFWMFTGSVGGKKYDKEDFFETTVRQFEDNTRRDYETLPAEQKDQIESGVSDFWNTFQAVGAEAKVIRIPDPVPATPASSTLDSYPSTQMKEQELPVTTTDDRTTRPVVPPSENPPVPPEVEQECIPQITMEAAPAMRGGLNPNSVGTFRIAKGELIPLVAEGADADQIIFDCIPKNGCPESGSRRKEGLTSEVRYEWHFQEESAALMGRSDGGQAGTFYGKCALLKLPDKSAAEWGAGFTDFYTVRLVILDALSGQPLDAPVVEEISVVASRKPGAMDDSVTVMIIGNSFSAYENPTRTITSGTCTADPLEWTVPVAFSLIANNYTVPSGQKWILSCQAHDTDDLTIRCTTNCDSDPKTFNYPDEVIYHWEIIGESGWFEEGPGIKVRSAFGREVVFLAPKHYGNEPLNIPVKITAYNQGGGKDPYNRSPVIMKANDPLATRNITVEIPCFEGGKTSPAEVVIGWTDHFLDHDIPDKIETLRHATSAIPVIIEPQSCQPKINSETSFVDPQLQDLAPGSGNMCISQREVHKSGNTIYLIDISAVYDAGIIKPSEEDLKHLTFLVDLYAAGVLMGLASGNLPPQISSEPLPSPLPATQSWSEQTFWFQTTLFDALLKSWKENEANQANEMGLVISIWSITSSPVPCNEACPASVEHVTMMSLGDKDHYYVRTSDVLVTTYINNVPKTEVFNFRTEKKGEGHP